MKSHGCTLDCFGCCKFNVEVVENKVVKIEGDKAHPYTKGLICQKGRKHLDRMLAADRILTPMKKVDNQWIAIDFHEAVAIVAEKLSFYKEQYGSNSVMHYSESGSGSVLKGIEDIFFNFYGGITTTDGGTCWSAGTQAQKYDFGYNRANFIDDMLEAKNIIFWSKNAANSHIHAMDRAMRAQKNGAKLIVIDPLFTDTAKKADIYIRIKPSTDAALAMAMTKIVIEDELLDEEFIKENVIGFEEYKAYLDSLDLKYLCHECGVKEEQVRELSHIYAKEKYSTIYLGYGLQRYKNGGNAVRAIDALASITGAIGKKGGGVNYSNKVYPKVLDTDPYNSSNYGINSREFDLNDFPQFSRKEIKAIFISKANPLNQWPHLNEFKASFREIDFKVCIDMFMTDTAKECDLFIPCTNTLETEDLLYSSMSNPYIVYNEKCVEPKHKLMDEYYFFMEVARLMKLEAYPFVNKEEYLKRIISPLNSLGITLEKIKNEYVTIMEGTVAWQDLKFQTPSGKIEIYSELAKKHGISAMPVYVNSNREVGKLRLLTTHPKNSLMSQSFKDIDDRAVAYVNEATAETNNIKNGEILTLKSKVGKISVVMEISEHVPDNTIHMNVGWWEKNSNPNYLTENFVTDMGKQIAYYDSFVEISK